MKPIQIPAAQQERDDNVAYGGGLDLISPEMSKKPSDAIEALNWDIPNTSGYRTHPGYERFDGRPKPSAASVTQLQVTTAVDGIVVVGDTVNGQTSGATGQVIYIDPARKWLALTKVTGTFQAGENLREGVTVAGVIEAFNQVVTQSLANQLAALAATVYRLDIQAVPGSGPVRGVWVYQNNVYAVRDNSGATAGVIHRATAGGWSVIALSEEISFTAGNSSVEVGDTLTQGGVTATVRRVIIVSGTSPNLVGKLVISGRAGGNFAAGAATSTGGGSLTLSGVQTAQAIPPGGKYEVRVANFAGGSATEYTYATNGVGKGFEFDGTYLAFVDSGMSPDTPKYLEVHNNRLWLAFRSSVQFSGPGTPHVWSVVLGANELAAGADITGLLRTPGSENTASLMVFTAEFTRVVYGKTTAEFRMDMALPDVGAIDYTAQNLNFPIFLDDLGLTSARAAQEFGNFRDADLSAKIKPYLEGRISLAACSVVDRQQGQYKLFLIDGSGVTATFQAGRLKGMLPFQLKHIPNVACEGKINGAQTLLFGGTDGFVYELNRGRSFDGATIEHRMRLADNFIGTPRLRKRMRRLRLDVQAPGFHTLSVGYVAGRNDPEIDSGSATKAANASGSAGGFDDAVVGFDTLGFDGDLYSQILLPLDVTTTSLSLLFSGSSDNELPLTITGQSMAWQPRRVQRQ